LSRRVGAALATTFCCWRRTIAPTGAGSIRASRGPLHHPYREGHRPDLADLRRRRKRAAKLATGIGDPGPMGRILVRGEPGHDIITELSPLPGEPVVDMPGKGAFFATDLDAMLKNRGIAQLIVWGSPPSLL